jgi:hypothetical protein
MKPSVSSMFGALRFLASYTVIGLVSWGVGFALFGLLLRLIFGEDMPSGDAKALRLWSLYAFIPCLFVVYLPALVWAENRWTDSHRTLTLAGIGGAVAIVPLLALGALFGGRSSGFVTLRTLALATPLVIAGILLGAGFSVIVPRSSD